MSTSVSGSSAGRGKSGSVFTQKPYSSWSQGCLPTRPLATLPDMPGRLPSDGMSNEPLPEPESEQLAVLLGDGTARLVYGLLYRRRSNPPTAAEIGFFLDTAASVGMSTDRVLRSLRVHFDIASVVRDGDERYQLHGRASNQPMTGRPVLSLRRRAQALALGFCAQCGRSPAKHGGGPEADRRVPPEV